MSSNVKTRTATILSVMRAVSLLAFLAAAVKSGAIFVPFVMSLFNPEVAHHLYEELDLYSLLQYDPWHYVLVNLNMALIPGLMGYMCLVIYQTLSAVNLQNPFSLPVAGRIQLLGQILFGVWIAIVVGQSHARWLGKAGDFQIAVENGTPYLFCAGLVFIIAQIFLRGVEIQRENELTV